MTLVVDASVAVKWVLPEVGAERAAKLRGQDDDFIAPDHIVSEIGNAIWKRVMWRELPVEDATRAADIAISLLTRLVPLEDLLGRALVIAAELQHPIYDCFYLALAEREQCPCITADKQLVAKAQKLKGIELRTLQE